MTVLEHDIKPETEPAAAWSYDVAFGRNRGLLTAADQDTLRRSHVAIGGLGGVGGVHLITLARLGIANFTIADPDAFEVANSNRQFGASVSNFGRSKVDVMRELVLEVNPEAEIRVFEERIESHNADEFLADADVLVDGIDLFAVEARRHLFRKAAEKGLYALTAGPVGFSTAWLAFAPDGMSFDEYFDLSDDMDFVQKQLAFLVGASPRATQLAYMDLNFMDFENHVAPSTSVGCQLAAGVMGAEVLKVLLKRGRIKPAPCYRQFDAMLGRFVQGRLWGGNRHPWQRIKRWWLYRQYRLGKAGWAGPGQVSKTEKTAARRP